MSTVLAYDKNCIMYFILGKKESRLYIGLKFQNLEILLFTIGLQLQNG